MTPAAGIGYDASMLMIAAWWACSAPPPCSGAIDRVTISAPNPLAPLAHQLDVSSGDPVTAEVTWRSDDHEVRLELPEAASHSVPLVGWRANRTYDVQVKLGRRTAARCTVDTPPLPARFPAAELLVAEEGAYEPGDTLVTARLNQAPSAANGVELVIVYDEAGEVIWYLTLPSLVQVAHEVEGGLLVTYSMGTMARVSRFAWSGIETASWTVSGTGATRVATTRGGNFHHDAIEVPGEPGRMMSLVRSKEAVDEWPGGHQNPEELGPADVSWETIVTFEEDGTVVDEVQLAELVPLERVGCDSLTEVQPELWQDWAHANALVVDDDRVVLSMRNQDAVISYDRDTAELAWILGNPVGWPEELEPLRLQPVDADMRWFFHAHAPMWGPDLEDGRRQLLLFDNGNYGATPPPHDVCRDTARARPSRVVAYWIDEDAGTVEEGFVLDQIAGAPASSTAVGDADWLAGGTVLSTWGMVREGTAGVAHLVEHDPATAAEVWHLVLRPSGSADSAGWSAIRADRIPAIAGRIAQ